MELKMGSDETFLYSPWDWLYCYYWSKRMGSFDCESLRLAFWALKAWQINMWFLGILHRSRPMEPKMGSNETLLYSPLYCYYIDLFSMGLIVLIVPIKENVFLWLWVSSFVPLCLKSVGQKWVIFGCFAEVRTFGTKKWGPPKHWSILHGIGSTPTADKGDCVRLVVTLSFKRLAKTVWFGGILHRSGPMELKMGSDETFLNSPWDWLYCYYWSKRMGSFDCESLLLAIWALKDWEFIFLFLGILLWNQKWGPMKHYCILLCIATTDQKRECVRLVVSLFVWPFEL